MNRHLKLVRQKNGIDALSRATGWRWEGDGLSFDGYDAHGEKIASVLTAGEDGNSLGALVKHNGQVHSATGSLESVLKFLKGFSQSE